MIKQRPSRIFIPSFSFSSQEKRSSREAKHVSRRSSIRSIVSPREPRTEETNTKTVAAAAPVVKPARQLEIVTDIEEPLFDDRLITPVEAAEQLPVPPSAALAAKWTDFLNAISTPASPAEPPADEGEDSELEDAAGTSDDYHPEDDDEANFDDLSAYFHIEVATPTVLMSPGKPKMIDISRSTSVHSSTSSHRARSLSCSSESSRYSRASAPASVNASPPGTPLSSAYDSDHTAPCVPGSFPQDFQLQSKLPSSNGKRHARDLTGSFIPVMGDDDELFECEEHQDTATRQTMRRPPSDEINRVNLTA